MSFRMKVIPLLFLTCYTLFTHGLSSPYDVHWLSGSINIEKPVPMSSKQTVDIYCYTGTTKSILALWQTVKFNLKIKTDEFKQYFGSTPDEVYKEYNEDSYGWSSVVNPFQKKSSKTVNIELFNSTCMAISTKQRHTIELQILRVDLWRVVVMSVGLALVASSRALSGNPVFFYLCGVLVGVCASFMVLVYYVSKLLPRKTLTYGLLIGGWTVGVYIFQQLWENVRSILTTYQAQLFWYSLTAGFVSFLVCYRIGPPKNRRSQNLVMWTLQGVGVLFIFFSSEYQEASSSIVVVALLAKYFPNSFIYSIKGYWLRKFPPKRRLLTNEEYYEVGARETKRALDSLREYCASPECAQWRVMMKLNDSKRFASFVEGESHLSDDEVLGYESYVLSLDGSRKPAPRRLEGELEISDDEDDEDSSGSD